MTYFAFPVHTVESDGSTGEIGGDTHTHTTWATSSGLGPTTSQLPVPGSLFHETPVPTSSAVLSGDGVTVTQ